MAHSDNSSLPAGDSLVSLPMADPNAALRVDRFRALIIGRANAGKTTILKAICASDRDPTVRDVQPSAERGEHNIYNELVFESNRRFVFHDSRGFEAGRADEIESMKQFIAEKANTGRLKDRLHAIWYCIPVDNDRLITSAELQFFDECDPQGVPVVLLFTKFESRDAKAFSELIKENVHEDEALASAPTRAEAKFQANELVRFTTNRKYPPKGFLFLRRMNDEANSSSNQHSTRIVEMTTDNLNDNTLRQLLISVQNVNIMLSVKYAIEYSKGGIDIIKNTRDVIQQLMLGTDSNLRGLWHSIGCWFPHVFDEREGDYNKPPPHEYVHNYHVLVKGRDIRVHDFKPVKLPQAASNLGPLHVLFTCACMLVVLENSSWLDGRQLLPKLKLASLHLIKSGTSNLISQDILASFASEASKIVQICDSEEEYLRVICPKLFDIVKKRLIPRDYQLPLSDGLYGKIASAMKRLRGKKH